MNYRSIISLFLLISLQPLWSFSQKCEAGCRELNRTYREAMRLEFADSVTSPLTTEDFSRFKNIPWFRIKKSYRVTAHIEFTPGEQAFEMPRSKGNTGTYRKFGVAVFRLKGKECRLNLYQSVKLMTDPQHQRYLFLPFADKTNGSQTYGNGRFLDLEIPVSGDSIVIDFNKAYNPLCAYNHKYSCPIPPEENRLGLKVKAGVKMGLIKVRKEKALSGH